MKDFIASINEDITTKQFVTWCLDKGKEEVKKHEDTLSNIPTNNTIIDKIEAQGYKAESNTTGGITITDNNQILTIKNGVIAVYELGYDFERGNGLLYLPQNDSASKQENSESIFIYQFSNNAYIKGTGTQEEYIATHLLKLWYDTFLATCGVAQEELVTLK